MADTSKIEWTDATWNPITGCTLVSEGCRNCYAAQMAATRLKNHPSRAGLATLNADGVAKFTGKVRFNEQWLEGPLRWRKPRMIFVCAHGDLFHEAVPDAWIDRVFAVMALCPQHTFQVLTKRPERMQDYFARKNGFGEHPAMTIAIERSVNMPLGMVDHDERMPLPNVWLGTSVEDQATADARIPHLLDTPAAKRFISAEPLLGPVDLMDMALPGARAAEADPNHPIFRYDALTGLADGLRPAGPPSSLDWVIVGGESGKKARPMHPDWVRSLRDQCAAAEVPFFFKQWGGWLPMCQDPYGQWDWGDADERGILHYWDRASDCRASMPLSKAKSGRKLDGKLHDGMPSPNQQVHA